jgi:DNA-binding HxlR family transcriptional regulator
MTYDVFSLTCPTRQVISALSDKWVTLVLAALAEGPQRFSQLARRVEGVSQKMLTQTLRSLERDGFVSRTVTPSVPVRVDYELTELGTELRGIVLQLRAFAESRMDRIREAREDYDAAVA